jgi:hypothetical protein
VARARSQGFDLQTQANIVGGLSSTLALGYTDAKYTERTVGPNGTTVINKGDTLPVPVWQGNLGLQYRFSIADKYNAYVLGNYQYQGKYYRTPGPGVATYSPDTRNAAAARKMNLRTGVEFSGYDVNLFVNNLLNSRDHLALFGGRSGCADAACANPGAINQLFSTTYYQPREIGLQVAYRY